MNIVYKSIIFIAAASMASCSEKAVDHTAEQAHEVHEAHEENSHADEIAISKEKAAKLGIQTARAKSGSFQSVLTVSGKVQPVQGGTSVIVAKSAGTVSFSANLVVGSAIRKNAGICRISSSNMLGGDPNTAAQITYETAKEEFERIKPLYEAKLVGAKEYQEAKQTYEIAKNAYLGQQGGSVCTSPMSGVVSQLLVENGTFVEAGTPIATISENQRLNLQAFLPQKYFSRFFSSQSANFKLPYDDTVFELAQMKGRRISAQDVASTDNGYVTLSFEFENNRGIMSGSYAEVYLLGNEQKSVISVPVSAITEEQGYYFIYVNKHGEHYEKRRVEIGGSNGTSVEIKSGLKENEEIVVSGAILVKLAANTGAVPEGHHHH